MSILPVADSFNAFLVLSFRNAFHDYVGLYRYIIANSIHDGCEVWMS